MEIEIGVNTRNSIWKRLSRNISDSKVEEFARAVNRAFSSMKICKTGSKVSVPKPVSSAFVYPDDRYLSNAEILRELAILERRFNKQTDSIAKAQGKEVQFKKAKPYHGDICPDLKPDTLSLLLATIRPARYTEDRFAVLEKLVDQVKERRLRLDDDVDDSDKQLKDSAF